MAKIPLSYAIDNDGLYNHISQITNGLKRDLMCPYCYEIVIARKDQHMINHFAHVNETCVDVLNHDFDELDVPLYEHFHLYISDNAWIELINFHNTNKETGLTILLQEHNPELISKCPDYRHTYIKTTGGKIPFGEATLNDFADFQLIYVLASHNQLSKLVELSYFSKPHFWGFGNKQRRSQTSKNLADLNFYRSQVLHLYTLNLYFLKIETTHETLFKIGTGKDIDQQMKDVSKELKEYFKIKKISLVSLCHQRGAVEHYVHHRYRKHKIKVGSLTGYYQFDKGLLFRVEHEFTFLGNMDLPEKVDWFWYFDNQNTSTLKNYKRENYRRKGLIAEILAGEKSWIQKIVEKCDLS